MELYKPIIYLHPDEKVYPISFEMYLKNSTVVTCDNYRRQWHPFRPPTEVVDNLKTYDLSPYAKWVISRDMKLRYAPTKSEPPRNLNTIPIYCKIESNEYFTDYIYIYLFPYNPSYKLCGIYLTPTAHYGDVEHIRVRVINNKSKNCCKISSVFYASHGSDQGEWVDNPTLVDGHPIVYVAKNSHASYATTGTKFRIFGLANDHVKKGGAVWNGPVDLLNDNNPITGFVGALNMQGERPINRIYEFSPRRTNIRRYRFFLPLYRLFRK